MLRRVKSLVAKQRLNSISELIPLLAHDEDFRTQSLNHLMVNVSSLFRDPNVFAKLKQEVFPYLTSFARLSIWVAGCAEGLEAYSLAILLEEEGLLDRTQIYATDINSEVLKQAASGVLVDSLNADDALRYNESLGKSSLSDYFVTAYGKQKLKQELLAKISFEHHDLTQQAPFLNAQLVLCRNVLIYFDKTLKNKVVNTLWDSLDETGYLVIGTKESIEYLDIDYDYTVTDEKTRIYKKSDLK
ncbi:MAG: chemotaxis protein CheR [Gammaproteobacteria bacterium]|nr:MAG: chemotaxis protein CheR [Gammaproteobacteria bacterium]